MISHNSRPKAPQYIEDRNSRTGYVKRYRVKGHLGKGGFANVYQVQSVDSSKIYACKVINKAKLVSSEHQRKLVSEIQLHRSLQHPNIVRFERHFEDKKYFYILLECCSNGSLMELSMRRTRLTEPEVRYFMSEILVAIQFLHSKSIIHRDLKLGNILLDADLTIKICDFGLAAKLSFDEERKTTICGTPNYTAPEILNQRKSGEGHSYEVDVWAIGVIMFTLLTGKPPFETKNIKETYRRIKKIKYQWPVNSDRYISAQAKNLISQIFMKSPDERPNLEQMSKHPFFTELKVPKSLPHSVLKRIPSHNDIFPETYSPQNDRVSRSHDGYGSHHSSTGGASASATSRSNSWTGSTGSGSSGSTTTGNAAGNTLTTSRPPLMAKEYQRNHRGDYQRDGNHGSAGTESYGLRSNYKQENDRENERQNDSENRFGGQKNVNQKPRDRNDRDDGNPMASKPKHSHSPMLCQKSRKRMNTENDDQNSVDNVMESDDDMVSVLKYIDYTKKYGMGYILTDGVTGIYFNDSTKIVLLQNRDNVVYWDSEGESTQCSLTNHPSCLKKKVTLLKHFTEYMWKREEEKNADIKVTNDKLKMLMNKIERHKSMGNSYVAAKDIVYVKRFISDQYCELFKFSNGMIQVNFTDDSRIIIKKSAVVYRNKKGITDTFKLKKIFSSNRKDLKKRCKYTQQLLQKVASEDRE